MFCKFMTCGKNFINDLQSYTSAKKSSKIAQLVTAIEVNFTDGISFIDLISKILLSLYTAAVD